MKKNKRKKIIIIVVVLILLLSVVFVFSNKAKNNNDGSIFVETTLVEVENLESKIITSGKVKSKSTRRILPELSGIVESIEIIEGEKVTKGQTLALLDSESIKRQIETAEINLQINNLNLEKLKNGNKESFATVLENAKLSYDEALKKYETNKQLFELGSISESNLENSETAMQLARNDYNSARKNYYGENNEEAIKIQELQIQLSKQNIENLKKDLEKTEIKSPIDGIVTIVNTDIGDIVNSSVQMFLVEDLENMEVETHINEFEVSKLSVGQDVKITGLGVRGDEYTGKVSYIGKTASSSNFGNSTETVVAVKIDFDSVTNFIPNYTADLEIVTASKKNLNVLSYDSLYMEKDGTILVYKVNDGVATKVEIEKGIEGDLLFEVISDELSEGDVIISSPTENITDGTKVETFGVESND